MDLLNINGIGETQLVSIKNFFSKNINVTILNELDKVLNVQNARAVNTKGLLRVLYSKPVRKVDGSVEYPESRKN